MKGWIKILVGVLAGLVVLSFAKDMAIKVSVEKGMEFVTGLKLRTGGFHVGLIKTDVGIRNLMLYNPSGFKDKVMLDMPRIYVNYSLPKLIGGTVYLKEVRIDMKEFTIVKNEKGELNLDSLKVVKDQQKGAPVETQKGAAPKMHIDSLQLKIGKVVYKDYSKGGEPVIQEFNLALDETYSNIDDPTVLVSLIVVKALTNTTIGRLTGFDVSGLNKSVSDTLSTATKTATETAKKLGETAKETTEEVTKQAAETVKNILPFGKK